MQPRLYTRTFFLLCASAFLFMMSFNLIIAELNEYISGLGGAEFKPLNIALFALAALISRPLSGRLTDRIGRIPIMIFGVMVCFVLGFLYTWIEGLTAYLFLRFSHGFSTGFKSTATTAYLADVAPPKRLGEAMGILGICGTLGMATGPALGSWIAGAFDVDIMFYTSSVVALISIVILLGMGESLEEREPPRFSTFIIRLDDLYEPRVLQPAFGMMLHTMSFGIITVLVPDLSDHLGLENRGTFFSVYVGISIFIRALSGKASDTYGRVYMLRWGMLALMIGMGVLSFADNIPMLMVSAVFFGIAVGINAPTFFAWTFDLAEKGRRGRATSTLFMALEGGIVIGSMIVFLTYGNDVSNMPISFSIASGAALVGFLYLTFGVTSQQPQGT